MSDLDHLTLGETPEEYIENEDGSVDIPDLPSVEGDVGDFYANLAETLQESDLTSISIELIELIDKDKESRKKRDEQYEEGIRRTGLGDDAPGGAEFSGASRVVHPVMAEACVDFQSSAIKELFPPSGPVKTDHIGLVTKDQIERGNRKKELMNWQLTKQMPEYYDELEQLLSQLPLGGAQYLKLRYDETMRRPTVEFVPIDEMLLPYAATSFYTASRVTHRQLITKHIYDQRVDCGFYRDVPVSTGESTPEQTSSAMATDKVEGIEDTAYNEDGLRAILEVYVWQELEDSLVDEGSAPYVIHIDEYSEKVLAIYRNWDDQDTTYEKLDWIVEFKFIPWRGAYGIGLPHLIGGLSAALTGALRALLDSAHINNAPSMLMLKGGRSVGANTQVNITEVTEITAPPNTNDIRQIAMPMPFNQPSPVLFQLMGFLTESAKGVVSTAEEKIANAGNNMPVGTAMALIEQGSKVFSAIHGRLHRSQAKVLEILHRINSKWLDVEDQQQKLGKVIATREDFIGSMDVLPASDPNIFSETQRFAQLQALLSMSQDPSVPWNKAAIYKRMMDLMHVPQSDELLPTPPEPVTSDPITETSLALTGKPIKAEPEQDHMTHINGHLAWISSPIVLSNPQIPPQIIQGLMGHINEHIMMLQSVAIASAVPQIMQESQGMSKEQASVVAVVRVLPAISQSLANVMQELGRVSGELQKRMPPPQMPPEVQASLKIAEMENTRRTQYDQATLQMKQQESQQAMGMEQARAQLEQSRSVFEQQMTEVKAQFEQAMAAQDRIESQRQADMQVQMDLLKNEKDNRQRQITELLKNHEDNQTAIVVEQVKLMGNQLTGFEQKINELMGSMQFPSV